MAYNFVIFYLINYLVMRVSLIIATYNWPESLILALRSIEKQTIVPEEVIIADDGSTAETKEIIDKFQKDSDLNIIHSWQEDKGFRVAQSRNKAIVKSSGDYIILVDGDMILHRKFIQDHIKNAQANYFVQGSRVLLTEDKSEKILDSKRTSFSFFSTGLKNRKNAIRSNLLSKIFSSKKNYLKGVRSCNMAFFKDDCMKVNGFNEDFIGWGREDSEFIVRLLNSGINRKTLRFNAVQYHLWHPQNKSEFLRKNNLLLKLAIDNNIQYCESGINRYIKGI